MDQLDSNQLRDIAYQFAHLAFTGHNAAYNAARVDGIERGLIVVVLDHWHWQPDGDLALHVGGGSGFQPIDDVPALMKDTLDDIDALMRILHAYDPRYEVVLTIMTPTEARSFRIGRTNTAITA